MTILCCCSLTYQEYNILVLGLFGGYVLSRNILNRISAINKTSIEIMDGDLLQRLPIGSSNDELNQLSVNLNNMLDRLNKLMTGMKDVSDNIAHDLRTPLNKIRTNLEVTLMSNPTSENYRNSIQEVIHDIDIVINTFNSLLAISRVESGSLSLEKEKVVEQTEAQQAAKWVEKKSDKRVATKAIQETKHKRVSTTAHQAIE